MQDPGRPPPTLGRRPGPRLRLTIPRVATLDELAGVDPPAWLRFQVKAAGKVETRHPTALIVCPFGHRFAIAGGHSIGGTTGAVEPQVGCPEAGCGWLAFVELDGWEPA